MSVFFFGGGKGSLLRKICRMIVFVETKSKIAWVACQFETSTNSFPQKICTHRLHPHHPPPNTRRYSIDEFCISLLWKKHIVFVVSRPVTQRAGRGKHEDLLGSWGRGVAQCQTITYLFPPSEDWAWFDGTKPLPAPGDRVPPGISFCTFVASHMLLRQPSPAYFPSHPVVSRRHAILALPFPHFSQAASSSFSPMLLQGHTSWCNSSLTTLLD